ncbi:MAG: glycoside hydrolase family 9 protein [Tannerellaceae bacterium]|jgi:hypothetical protein|nr:glycoside hydrolase family 9 protein [Tannerellaceae bacterium]
MKTHFLFRKTGKFVIVGIAACLLQSMKAQTVSGFITIDQFGYRPEATKMAVIRDPQTGFDAAQAFVPGMVYQVVDARTRDVVFSGSPLIFNKGLTDEASGDRIWWFDFSGVAAPGTYYILDKEKNLKSYTFSIREDVYNELLKHAVRMFFYQRAGFEKEARFAGEGWADGASHIGPLQDKNCRLFNKKNDASTERDLHGGWYDAGDYNKYTAWTANYIECMLLIYRETPDVFTDDYNIPESGNGIPDLLDEVKWGMDWLLRMRNEDGSLLSIVGLSEASPPSAATGQSLYGPANTIATITSAKAFALGARVFREAGLTGYADRLKEAALKAWQWAEANPNVVFHNNNASYGSRGLGAGDQENENPDVRLENRCLAGFYLYELTGDKQYLSPFETSYKRFPLYSYGYFMQQYWHRQQLMFLKYVNAPYAKEEIKNEIREYLIQAFNNNEYYAAQIGRDGYRSYIKDYNWSSNQYKSEYGLFFYLWAQEDMEPAKSGLYYEAAEDYIHYIHGVNPFNRVYLTNMNERGASHSITEIFHTWFSHNSPLWDKAGVSTYGPAPGYLAGGPNAWYSWDDCCDNNGCGSAANNAMCLSEELPIAQPPSKMYKDFNTSWPLNSWELTEPSDSYQVAYIRLLAKFVSSKGSHTGISDSVKINIPPAVYPNPVKRGEDLNIVVTGDSEVYVSVYTLNGQLLLSRSYAGKPVVVNTSPLQQGIYLVKITTGGKDRVSKIIVH